MQTIKMSMTATEKRAIKAHVLAKHAARNPRAVRFDADGSVSVMVDAMPNTNQPGRIFAGWDSELLGECEPPAKRGAPFQMDGAVRRNIFTDAESWELAQRIGNGNASLGIRLALAAYPGKKS